MRKIGGLVSALALCAATFADARAQDAGIPLGTPAPDAEVQNLEGRPVQLRSLIPAGQPALIEFWAVWCGECEKLQPQLDALHARHGDDLAMVAVAVGVAQTLRRVNRHLEAHDPGYPVVWDAQGAAVRAYDAPTTSFVVLIDRAGNVAYTGVGGDQALGPAVERVLGGGSGH